MGNLNCCATTGTTREEEIDLKEPEKMEPVAPSNQQQKEDILLGTDQSPLKEDFISPAKTPADASPSNMNNDQKLHKIMTFKDFKGFKKIDNLKDRYKVGKVLGEGSFGQVRIALHKNANIKCAVKIIKKEKINEHKILQGLMDNEL